MVVLRYAKENVAEAFRILEIFRGIGRGFFFLSWTICMHIQCKEDVKKITATFGNMNPFERNKPPDLRRLYLCDTNNINHPEADIALAGNSRPKTVLFVSTLPLLCTLRHKSASEKFSQNSGKCWPLGVPEGLVMIEGFTHVGDY